MSAFHFTFPLRRIARSRRAVIQLKTVFKVKESRAYHKLVDDYQLRYNTLYDLPSYQVQYILQDLLFICIETMLEEGFLTLDDFPLQNFRIGICPYVAVFNNVHPDIVQREYLFHCKTSRDWGHQLWDKRGEDFNGPSRGFSHEFLDERTAELIQDYDNHFPPL